MLRKPIVLCKRRAWAVTAGAFAALLVASPVVAESTARGSHPRQAIGSEASSDVLDKQLISMAALDSHLADVQAGQKAAQQALDAANQAIASDEQAILETTGRINLSEDHRSTGFQQPNPSSLAPSGVYSQAFSVASVSVEQASLPHTADQDMTLAQLQSAKADLEHQRSIAVGAAKSARTRLDDMQKKVAHIEDEQSKLALSDQTVSQRASRGGARSDGQTAQSAQQPEVSSAGLIWPVDGKVSSPFGYRWGRLHEGIDIEASDGTPIHAAKAGTVIKAQWYGGYGNYTCLDSGDLVTCYGHQSRLGATVGQIFNQGDVIGYAGHTGSVVAGKGMNGAHVHFEVRTGGYPGKPENPTGYLSAGEGSE